MGVTEEASKTAATVVAALQQTPMILALVIFNILFMMLIGWWSHENGARFERMMTAAMECQTKTDK